MSKVTGGTQLEVPGNPPALDPRARLEGELNEAIADVQDAERALRGAKVRERAARAALGRLARS